MIKVSDIDVGTLVNLAKDHELAYAPAWPGWLEMELPRGRNMKQCYQAADAMFNMHLQAPSVPSLKRKSADILDEQLSKRPSMMPPIDTSYYSQASRSFGPPSSSQTQVLQSQSLAQALPTHSHTQSQTQPVSIQPRPPSKHVGPCPGISSPPVSTTMLPAKPTRASRGSARGRSSTGRKRGRPSKADKEEWARQNALQSHPTVYAPIIPAPAGTQPSSSTYQHTFSIATPGATVIRDPTAYRAVSNESVPESASQRKEPSPGQNTHKRAHSAPRTLLPAPATNQLMLPAEEGQRHEHSTWRDSVLRVDKNPPTPRETRMSHGYILDQQIQRPDSPYTPEGHREGMTAAIEPVTSGGLPAVTNQA
jgi:hypothetical protein